MVKRISVVKRRKEVCRGIFVWKRVFRRLDWSVGLGRQVREVLQSGIFLGKLKPPRCGFFL